jgi:hypothetical protein
MIHALTLLLPLLAGPAQAEDTQKKIQKLIEQMDDDSFDVRNQASKALVDIGHAALEALKRAAHEHLSPELRARAEQAVLSIYRRELPVREGTIMLSGIRFFDKERAMLATSCDTGLALLVIPHGRVKVRVLKKGVEIRSVEDGVETQILYTVFDIQVTMNEITLKGFSEEDLKARHPEAHAALLRHCRALPLDFAQAQVITDFAKPPKQPVADYVKDIKKSFTSLIELIRTSGVAVDLQEALTNELEAERKERIEAAQR